MKKLLMILLASPFILVAESQAQRVVRKGVQPVKVKTRPKTIFYTVDQLNGKWQEYSRKDAGSSTPQQFKDTLMLSFNKRDSVYVYDGVSMSQKGLAAIEAPASLSLAGDTYSIMSMSKTTLVLNDGEFIRSFKKMHRFNRENFGNLKADAESFEKPMPINAERLKGRWDIYRRQAKPGTTEAVLVKSITFSGATKDSITGNISTYSSGNTQTENFTGYILGTSMYINTPNFKGNWTTYKADGKEFVFGKENEIIYYAKKF